MSSGLFQMFVELGNLHGTSNFIEITGVGCSDSVCHNWVQVTSIPVYYSPVVRIEPSDNGGARGVVVIVVENGHGDTSSNPGPD